MVSKPQSASNVLPCEAFPKHSSRLCLTWLYAFHHTGDVAGDAPQGSQGFRAVRYLGMSTSTV
jgi:hypothetical protein